MYNTGENLLLQGYGRPLNKHTRQDTDYLCPRQTEPLGLFLGLLAFLMSLCQDTLSMSH